MAYQAFQRGENLRTSAGYIFRVTGKLDVDYGTFSQQLMNTMVTLWARLEPKLNRRSRMQMDWLELSMAIFAARIGMRFRRYNLRTIRRSDPEVKRNWAQIRKARERLQEQTNGTITILERYRRRAERRSRSTVTNAEYAARVAEWRAHARWIRYNLAYFNPLPSYGLRKLQRLLLDRLVAVAIAAIADEGYEAPEPAALRRVIRRFHQYSRQGRIFPYHHLIFLRPPIPYFARVFLAEFVVRRLQLRRIAPAKRPAAG